MSNVSVDSSAIQKLIKNSNDSISRLERTKQSLERKYQSLGATWSDSKYQNLGVIIEDCSAAINSVKGIIQDCLQKLEFLNVHIKEYESVNFGSGSSTATDGSFMRTVTASALNNRSGQVAYWNQQLSSLSERVRAFNTQHFSQYISAERLNRPLSESVVFDSPESRRVYGMSEYTLGFNDGRRSHIFVGTGHETATTVHENLHQLSANDSLFRSRRGIIENNQGSRQNVQMNEAITEMLTRRTLGADYGEDYSAYSDNRDAMELIESCMGSETIYEAYFQNRPELMVNQFESVMGEGSWGRLSEAFDDCVSEYPHDRTSGTVRRDSMINDYMRLSASRNQNQILSQDWRNML